MKKLLFILSCLLISFSVNGEIIVTENLNITAFYAYDDVENVAAYLFLSVNHEDCPQGAYINPNAIHFNSLYSTILSAFIAGRTVQFQLYNDRLHSNRCEVDAIRVFAN